MPVTVIAIVATVWALARSNEIEVKSDRAKRDYGSANPTFVIQEMGTGTPEQIESDPPAVLPVERRMMSVPMAAGDAD